MQLIRSNQFFCLLTDFSVFWRQKLRRNRRTQYIEQNFTQSLRRTLCLKRGQIAHEGLGNGSVDPIHGHVIAVIGRPAQRKLGQISGSNHQPALLIGNIHQQIGALTRLCIFKGHI